MPRKTLSHLEDNVYRSFSAFHPTDPTHFQRCLGPHSSLLLQRTSAYICNTVCFVTFWIHPGIFHSFLNDFFWHHTLRFTLFAVKFCGSWQVYGATRASLQCLTVWVHFPENPLCSTHFILLPSPWPLATSDLFTVSVFAFSRISYNWNHYVPFSNWLLSLSNMYLRFIPAFLQLETSFLFITE